MGTFSGGVWSPGRDDAGAVNAVSWLSTPTGEWFQTANTRLEQLDSEVKALVPGWKDYGTEGWSGVTNDWNGLTADLGGNRVWLVAGGGHSGSSNNGVYEFDAYRMKWRVEHPPSDTALWSAAYRGSNGGGTFSSCPESVAAYQAEVDAGTWNPIGGRWYDEVFWDRAPTSRHTYSAHDHASVTNEIILSARGQRLWRYSLDSHQWTYRRVLEDKLRDYDGAGTYAFYDEKTQEYLHGGNADGIYNSIGYRLGTNTWFPWGSPWAIYGGADARFGRAITFLAAVTRDSVYAGQYWRYDLDTRSVTVGGPNTTVQFAGGLTRTDFPPGVWYYDGSALAFVPPQSAYWYFTLMGNGQMTLLKLDPTTTPWTLTLLPTTGRVPTPHRNLMRKMLWMPRLNAVMLVDEASKDVYFYRF